MSISKDLQEDLAELIELVRRDEQFSAVLAHGALRLDWQSSVSHKRRARRIEELSQKYGLV